MPFVSNELNVNLQAHIDSEAARKSSRDYDDYKSFKPLEYGEQTKTWWNYIDYTHQLLLKEKNYKTISYEKEKDAFVNKVKDIYKPETSLESSIIKSALSDFFGNFSDPSRYDTGLESFAYYGLRFIVKQLSIQSSLFDNLLCKEYTDTVTTITEIYRKEIEETKTLRDIFFGVTNNNMGWWNEDRLNDLSQQIENASTTIKAAESTIKQLEPMVQESQRRAFKAGQKSVLMQLRQDSDTPSHDVSYNLTKHALSWISFFNPTTDVEVVDVSYLSNVIERIESDAADPDLVRYLQQNNRLKITNSTL